MTNEQLEEKSGDWQETLRRPTLPNGKKPPVLDSTLKELPKVLEGKQPSRQTEAKDERDLI